MTIDLEKNEASLLLEALTQKPVSLNIGAIIQGVKADDSILALVAKLNVLVNKPTEPEVVATEPVANFSENSPIDAEVAD